MVALKSGTDKSGTKEYYLVGLEDYDDYEIVINLLIEMNVLVLDSIDGIYSRTGIFEMRGHKFKLLYHEDVGVYAFLLGEPSPESDEMLQKLLSSVVDQINN